ncbi:HAMP domain-containing protein [Persephonella sp.]
MTEKRSSVLNQISLIVFSGSFLGALFVGGLVYYLLSDLQDPKVAEKTLYSMLTSQLVFLGLVYFIRVTIDKIIISKIKNITKALEEVSMGNLDYEIKSQGNDEITDLVEAFERMRISMKTIIEKMER